MYLWNADEWLYNDTPAHEMRRRHRITTRTSDARIEAIATSLLDEAARDSQVIDWDDLVAELQTLRDEGPARA